MESDTIRAQLVSTLAGAEKRLKEAIKALPGTQEVKVLKKALREHDGLAAYLASHPLIAAVEATEDVPPPESANGVAEPDPVVDVPNRRKAREEAGS